MLNGIKEPVLDLEKLQEVANKAAEKAAIDEIESFFTRYNSPFRKKIEDWLKNNIPNEDFQIPNFIETVQKAIVSEVEKNINVISIREAVKSIRNGIMHLPLDNDGSIKLSKVFEEMSSIADTDNGEIFEASLKEESLYGWINVDVNVRSENKDFNYSFTLHKIRDDEKYTVIMMPSIGRHSRDAVVKTEDGLTIQLPVLQGLSNNPILLTVAKLCMFRTPVIVDTKSFYKSNDED